MIGYATGLRAMDDKQVKRLKARNVRTALILLSVALAFFAGIIWRRWS